MNRHDTLTNRRGDRHDAISGFTLIEVLVVIVILGILGSVVVYAVQDMSRQTASASCRSDFKTVETAEETYASQVGHPATSIGDLARPLIVAGGTIGPWIKEAPATSNGYTIGLEPLSGDVTVASGASHPASPGMGNCSYA